MKTIIIKFCNCLFLLLIIAVHLKAQTITVLQASNTFDGEKMQKDWTIVIEGERIIYAGTTSGANIPTDVKIISSENGTLMPGMIEGHSHILLHPYNETSWNDQVLVESEAERVVRATNHAKATVMAGFTTIRDLGSEGAGYADVGIKISIEKGIIIGPRMIVAGKAIVAEGSYGPKGFHDLVKVPLGAEVAGGHDNLIKVVRDQIGKGADVIKVYSDYRWGPFGQAMPTFTLNEMKLIVEVANSSGRQVAAHAATEEGMRRAALAGVSTIEHGDGATMEVLKIMKENKVALCPTLAAGDAIMQYRGWNKGVDPEPERIIQKKESFRQVLASGVTIVAGGDVGVFTHGENARELEMMVEYGMNEMDVLKSVTSVNAAVFGYEDKIGRLKENLFADIIIVNGNPSKNISALKEILFVMKSGKIIKNSL